MSDALSLVHGSVGQPRPQIIYATVSENQPIPSSFTDALYVVEPHNPNNFRTITHWPACHGSTLPAAGADCVCVYDNHRTLRCVWWDSPQTSFAGSNNSSLQVGDLIVNASQRSVRPFCLLCDGSSYATSAYTPLFLVIGYAFGGSGSNFNVPSITAPVSGTHWFIYHG